MKNSDCDAGTTTECFHVQKLHFVPPADMHKIYIDMNS